MKPTVLLVVPTHRYGREYPAPLSLADFPAGYGYLASALIAQQFTVHGLNLNNISGYSSAPEMVNYELSKALAEYSPDVIGIGGICADYHFLKDTISVVREVSPNARIVLGGGIANHDAVFVAPLLGVDCCIKGDGEKGLPDLLRIIEAGGNGTLVEGRVEDLDTLPFPDYSLFNDRRMMELSVYVRYLYRYTRPKPRVMSIVTARGCPFSCSFCIHRRTGQRPYRMRSIPNIMAEIKVSYERYEFNILIILDELFAVNKARLREFCEAILMGKEKYGWDFDWCFQTHASANLNVEALKLAKAAGCYSFAYGLESSSPSILASMDKHTKPAQIASAAQICDLVSMGYLGAYIFGDRAETRGTIKETLTFFDKHLRDNHIYFGSILPYPGSRDFDYCMERGIIKDKTQYYETIDEHLWNMTRIPDILWYPWAYLAGYLGIRFGWVKKARLKSGNILECPHCGHDVLLAEEQAVISVATRRPLRLYLWRLKYLLGFLLTFWHPIYWTLLPLLGKKNNGVTGCRNCGKRLAIP